MQKKILILASAVMLLSCESKNVNSDVPTTANYNIVDTNQSECFNNQSVISAPAVGSDFYGQDAQFSGNQPSYTDNGDGTITDNVTGLIWQQSYMVMTYNEAIDMLENFSYAGYSDWRLPTNKEAFSLMMFSGTDLSESSTNPIPFINTDYFDFDYAANGSREIDSQLLTSTLYTGSEAGNQLMFGVNFADGRIKGYEIQMMGADKEFMVRFVRGAQYGENIFVDNDDNTISDNATGLMWAKNDNAEAVYWKDALAYAAKMNAENYLGYSDWRLPNAKELHSIVDYTRSPQATSSAAISPLFNVTSITNERGQVDYPFFWTSTTHKADNTIVGGAGVYIAFGRALGNMANAEMPGMTSAGGDADWVDIHGAGCQRSDPKTGDPSEFVDGRGPQGDAIRILNYARLVRDL